MREKTKRNKREVVDSLFSFLGDRWSYGETFSTTEVKKANRGIIPSTEKSILDEMIAKQLLTEEVQQFKIGNGIGLRKVYTVISHKDEELEDFFLEYVKRFQKVNQKTMEPLPDMVRQVNRTGQEIRNNLFLFLTKRKKGDVFMVKHLKKEFKVKTLNSDLMILRDLQEKGFVSIRKTDKSGKMTKENHYTILSNDSVALKKIIYNIPQKENAKTKEYPLYPKESMDKADIELLRNRLKKMTVTNENLKLDLDEALETIEKLEVKLESKDNETKKANGLSKSCPSCGFNMERYVVKHGKQVKAILDDCR